MATFLKALSHLDVFAIMADKHVRICKTRWLFVVTVPPLPAPPQTSLGTRWRRENVSGLHKLFQSRECVERRCILVDEALLSCLSESPDTFVNYGTLQRRRIDVAQSHCGSVMNV